ncbi:MAG: DinB family protein [Chloroflexota bacterium]
MPHHLVNQLRFARSEFVRGFEGITDEDARIRLMPMNSISWIIGHLANQENSYWVYYAQKKMIVPGLRNLVGYGKPASTPPLDEMWDAWHEITSVADVFLNTITEKTLSTYLEQSGLTMKENIGTVLQRNIYHYWFHLGEGYAVREQLGHQNLPEFVGSMVDAAYPEN